MRAAAGVIARRLHNQRLAASSFRDPAEVVAWLGAVQSQEYAVAKWAIGLRAVGLTDARVEQAFADGRILRTHVLRPTWHFVAPADIRWMLALTAPRICAQMATPNRTLDLTPRLFARSHAIVARALEGGTFLTRAELAAALARRGIEAHGQRLGHLMMQAELDQVICSGPRRGKLFTYALLAERAPRAALPSREQSVAELVRRFFSSHGPATLRDFSWWSGLTMADGRAGLEQCGRDFVREEIDGLTYWSPAAAADRPRPPRAAHLLPIYDEYLNAYRDRALVIGERTASAAGLSAAAGTPHYLIVDGRLAGSWKRVDRDGAIAVTVSPSRSLSAAEVRHVRRAAARFGEFQQRPIETSFLD